LRLVVVVVIVFDGAELEDLGVLAYARVPRRGRDLPIAIRTPWSTTDTLGLGTG
jgi:hypothetical protein